MKVLTKIMTVSCLLALTACHHTRNATTTTKKETLEKSEMEANNKRLFQREWTLVEISGVSKNELSQMDNRPTLNVAETISGFGGCNRLIGGTYVLKGNEITISRMASTKKLCVGVGQKVEDALLAILNDAKTYKMEDVHLKLTTADNRTAEFIAFDKE